MCGCHSAVSCHLKQHFTLDPTVEIYSLCLQFIGPVGSLYHRWPGGIWVDQVGQISGGKGGLNTVYTYFTSYFVRHTCYIRWTVGVHRAHFPMPCQSEWSLALHQGCVFDQSTAYGYKSFSLFIHLQKWFILLRVILDPELNPVTLSEEKEYILGSLGFQSQGTLHIHTHTEPQATSRFFRRREETGEPRGYKERYREKMHNSATSELRIKPGSLKLCCSLFTCAPHLINKYLSLDFSVIWDRGKISVCQFVH